MTKYRKKPITVEAIQFVYSTEGIHNLHEFCGDAVLLTVEKARHPNAKGEAHIRTLEDGKDAQVQHIATEGDWIIKGVQGEFYPCKPDIFKQTYEEVTDD